MLTVVIFRPIIKLFLLLTNVLNLCRSVCLAKVGIHREIGGLMVGDNAFVAVLCIMWNLL